MRDLPKRTLRLIREVAKIEFMSEAGRVNIVVILLAFTIPVGSSAFDLPQMIIRSWNPEYESGLPSTERLFLLWLLFGFACVVVIAALRKKSD